MLWHVETTQLYMGPKYCLPKFETQYCPKKMLFNPISHGGGVFRTPSPFAAFGDPLTVKYIGMFYGENS